MDNKELKNKILDKTLDNNPLILVYNDYPFLALQYVKEISKIHNLEIMYIKTLSDIPESIFGDDPYLYVLLTKEISAEITSLKDNLIIVCENCSDNLQEYCVKMHKIEPWQIHDFVQARLPGLSEAEINWLCEICNNDIYRLDNECSKLEIFPKGQQEQMFINMSNDNGYSDLNNLTIYNYINYMVKRDLSNVSKVLSDLRNIDIEGTGVVTLLLKQFLNIINIQTNSKATPESLGLSPKQFNGIRYSCGYYSNEELVNIYDFLTEVDYRLKSGMLQFSNDARINNENMVDYITCSVLSASRGNK